MTNYTGIFDDTPFLIGNPIAQPHGPMETMRKEFYQSLVSATKSYAGTYSLELKNLGRFTVDVGLEAGARTITMKAWAPINGSLRVKAIDPDDGSIMDTVETASEDEWEDVEVAFTAEKKVYLLIFIHLGVTDFTEGEDISGYIDNIAVS